MNRDQAFIRSELLIGSEGMEALKNSHVAIFGVGGVGSFAAEVLARTGLGQITLIDYDTIDISNINRQIHANSQTIGMDKVSVMAERLLTINPNIKVNTFIEKYNQETREVLLEPNYDYIIDAIDMISSKIDLIVESKKREIPIISSMGAGNKLDPTAFKIGDIYDTKVCPLAKVMRRELRKREVSDLKVIWSEEEPLNVNVGDIDKRKATPGSIAFIPSVVGISIGGEVIKDIALRR